MSKSQRKLLWLQRNMKKLSAFAKRLDAATTPHNLSPADIDALIKEAKEQTRKK
jgi:hypothetical protein